MLHLLDAGCFFYQMLVNILATNKSNLSSFSFVLNVGVSAFIFMLKFHFFLLEHKTIYKLNKLLLTDLIAIDETAKRLVKDQKFCVKIATLTLK